MFTTHKLQGAGGVGGDSFELVTSNASSFTEGQTTHTFPSGIQAGDLLVMAQSVTMDTTGGFSPYADTGPAYGTGFTLTSAYYGQVSNYYKPTAAYSYGFLSISYKVSNGTESGATIGGFEVGTNSYGTPYGVRRLLVFRPNFTHLSNVGLGLTGTYYTHIATATATSHTASTLITPSATLPSCGIAFFASSGLAKVSTISGGLSSFNNSYSASSGSYIAKSVFTGAFTCSAGTPQITVSGPTNTTDADGMLLCTFTLS